ncbi:hypothetical protein M378DRAFT_165976, partial [Amanita muscaria Koide BX008]
MHKRLIDTSNCQFNNKPIISFSNSSHDNLSKERSGKVLKGKKNHPPLDYVAFQEISAMF